MNSADLHLKTFCEKIQLIYGPQAVTPNMHYHLHLKKCITNYGPIHAFWLFSFERYNGILGSYHTNQRAIEIQVMRKFCNDMTVKSIAQADVAVKTHSRIFSSILNRSLTGSAQEAFGENYSIPKVNVENLILLALPKSTVRCDTLYLFKDCKKFLPPFVHASFDNDNLKYLIQSYITFVPQINMLDVPKCFEKCGVVLTWGERMTSYSYVSDKYFYIQAYWVKRGGLIDSECSQLHFGVVEYFFRQKILIQNDYHILQMAKVQWLQELPFKNHFGKPYEIWPKDLYESLGTASFIPINRISNQCVVCLTNVNSENVYVVCPIKRKIFI